MAGSCKSLLLLRRCANSFAQIKTRAKVLTFETERFGYIQQHQLHKWTPAAMRSLRSPSKYEPCEVIRHFCAKEHAATDREAAGAEVTGRGSEADHPVDIEYPPLPAYSTDSEIEKKEVFVIQAKGLPWSCTAEDILTFFSECRICGGAKGVHFTVNSLGKPSGQAFIEMENEEDVSKALEKDRHYLGSRYIEVYEVTNDHAESILKESVDIPANDGVVRLRGLPFSCTEEDVIRFFSGLDIVENGVTIVINNRGRNSGEAYVQFVSQDMATEALQRDRDLIGSRYIEVFPSRLSEIRSSWSKDSFSTTRVSPFSSPRKPDFAPQQNSNIESQHRSNQPPHYVHMRGLPFQATGQDIAQFFSPLALSKILIEYDHEGKPTGDASVYFTSHQDAVSAMARDKDHMGERFIELFLNSSS